MDDKEQHSVILSVTVTVVLGLGCTSTAAVVSGATDSGLIDFVLR